MKKVALVGCYFQHNYGSQLQALALQEFLKSKKIPVEYIDVTKLSDFAKGKKKYYKRKILDLKFVRAKFGMALFKIKKKISHSNKIKQLKIRDRKFDEFKHNFSLSKKYHTYKELHDQALERYSNVIVGSDQLWLPVNVIADFYTLNWVPDSINKISYSTSFGFSSIPKKYEKRYINFLSRINSLSVREESGNSLIRSITNLDVTTVCDPTMLLTKSDWLKLASRTNRVDGKYIFVYFLGKNKEHWEFVKRLQKITGLKIISLNHCDEFFKTADKYTDKALYDVDPFDFINLITNAEYVCTDSFHGSIFSILNNRKFFTFRRFADKSKVSTNSRIYSLLKSFDLQDHLLNGDEKIDDALKINFDYKIANSLIEEYRNLSSSWLLSSIKHDDERPIRVDGLKKWECSGCQACMNACPKQCIKMESDKEGFLYPSIANDDCINCGICMNVCPVNKDLVYDQYAQYGYVVQNKDEVILKESTSGGAFSAFAKAILDENGHVYGVKLDTKTFTAQHVLALNYKEISSFRNSKYVQSDTGRTFSSVKDDLMQGKKVLYSGTTCQIEGLYSFLKLFNVDMSNLFLIDVICRCVTSPLVLKNYMEYQNNRFHFSADKIIFRDKSIYGYDYSNLSIYAKGKKKYHQGVDKDPYLKLMFDGTSIRPSCASCHFKHQLRHSDITIWDCFDVGNYDSALDNNKGATKILINSPKGAILLEKSLGNLKYKEVSADSLIYNNYEMFNSPSESLIRERFFSDMYCLSNKQLFKKYGSASFKSKISNLIKHILIFGGLYSKIKAKKMANRRN